MSDSAKTIKVFNLTDIETPTLRQHNAVDITFAAGRALINPGGSDETEDDVMTRAALAHYIAIGAASVDVRPPSYVVAKAQLEKQAAMAKAEADAQKKAVPVEPPVEPAPPAAPGGKKKDK